MQRVRACAATAIGAGAVLWLMTMVGDAAAQDKATVEAGENVYDGNCAACHGDRLRSTGQFFDLRRLKAEDRARFDNSVRNGKGQMPPWKGVLSDEEIDQIWAYIRAIVDR
jgi:mono/diheme cytochrome c family protein